MEREIGEIGERLEREFGESLESKNLVFNVSLLYLRRERIKSLALPERH